MFVEQDSKFGEKEMLVLLLRDFCASFLALLHKLHFLN